MSIPSEPPCIVVADDTSDMCELLAEICEPEGRVVALPGGELLHDYLQAAARGDQEQPDLVVSDVRMPHYGGLNALRFVSTHLPETEVILVTAFGDQSLHEQAKRRGALDVLNKPFAPTALREAVRCALDARA